MRAHVEVKDTKKTSKCTFTMLGETDCLLPLPYTNIVSLSLGTVEFPTMSPMDSL